MRAKFLGKDPKSRVGQSSVLFATNRTDRETDIARGWVVTDPEVLADSGLIPESGTPVEIPKGVLRFFEKRREVEDR